MDSILERFNDEQGSVVIGLSTLKTIGTGGLLERPGIRVVIPDNLKRLVSAAAEGSDEHIKFLVKIINDYDPSIVDGSDAELVNGLYRAFRNLSEMNMLSIITDDDIDTDVAEALAEGFLGPENEISLSPKRNFLREYFTKTISWCKKTGGLIIEKTRRGFNDLGHYIATLQLPDRFDDMVLSKKKYVDKVFSFPGGKGTKWFVALVSGGAGFAYPPLGIPGLIIAFVDP